MAKRGARDTLTGGTGDVNPQFLLSPRISNATPGSLVSVQLPLPIQRLPTTGRAQVLEILKVTWDFDFTIINTDAATTLGGIAYLTTRNPNNSAPSTVDNTTVDWIEQKLQTLSATSGGIAVQIEHPFLHDLTDGAGHGVLIGTDYLFLSLLNPSGYTAGNVTFSSARILYRWKDVSLAEYIGMVQSQQ